MKFKFLCCFLCNIQSNKKIEGTLSTKLIESEYFTDLKNNVATDFAEKFPGLLNDSFHESDFSSKYFFIQNLIT